MTRRSRRRSLGKDEGVRGQGRRQPVLREEGGPLASPEPWQRIMTRSPPAPAPAPASPQLMRFETQKDSVCSLGHAPTVPTSERARVPVESKVGSRVR